MSSPAPEHVVKFKSGQSLVLKAGAGAGKTTTLIRLFFEQVFHFKEQYNKWPRVILTTFTRKATQEIRERLLKEALNKNDPDLLNWLQSKYFVQISTIHGILSTFLTQFGDRLNIPNDFNLIDESVILKEKKSILKKIFNSNPEFVEILEEFSFAEILTLTSSYVSTLAYEPYTRYTKEDLNIDLNNEIFSWQQVCNKLLLLSQSETLSEKWTSFVTHFTNFINFQKNDLDLNSKYLLLKALKESAPSKPPHTSGKSKVSDEFNDLADNVKELLTDLVDKKLILIPRIKDYENVSLQIENICRQFAKDWRRQQSDLGLMTMEDLEILSAEILRQDPSIGLQFSRNYDYWMIDEYQDTSPLQVFLLNSLRGVQDHFVVGDPQQSIYLFRGARSEVFEDKIKEIQCQGGEVHKQLINYRSRREVLNLINMYFSKAKGQFEEMSVGSANSNIELPSLAIYPFDKKSNQNEVIEEQWTEKAAVHRVSELLKQGARPEEICILSRNHKNLKLFSRLATEMKIPFSMHSSGNYYRQSEIKDALALLRFIDNPHDNLNFIALLRSPWFFQTDEKILKYCDGQSYWLTALNKFPQHIEIKQLQSILEDKKNIGDLAAFEKNLMNSKLIETSKGLDPSGQREANLWKLLYLCHQEQNRGFFQLADFINKAEKIDSDSSGEDRESAAVAEPSRIQLMTIHASKGLQFPHVIILGFGDEGRLPQIDLWNHSESQKKWCVSIKDQENGSRLATPLAQSVISTLKIRELEESERLLYVAMTRAQTSLTFVWSQVRKRSWAATFPFDLSEGSHKLEGFTYDVRKNIELDYIKNNSIELNSKIRKPWQIIEQNFLESTSVTAILNPSNMNSQKDLATYQLPDLEKSKFGQKVHRLFEALSYKIDLSSVLLADDEVRKALQFVLQLKIPPMQEILEHGFAEWGFTVPWNKSKLVGQIDLWAKTQNCLWVIDYKTGDPKSSQKSLEQLQIYAECLFRTKRTIDNTKIILAALYPISENVFMQEFADRNALLKIIKTKYEVELS